MNMLVHEYELFVMKKDENISETSTRFTNIVNCLKALGKIYTNQENVRKILRSLPKKWEAKMTVISEARDLKVLTLEELFGSLMTYELEMNSKLEEEDVKPKKNFALKSSHHDHDINHRRIANSKRYPNMRLQEAKVIQGVTLSYAGIPEVFQQRIFAIASFLGEVSWQKNSLQYPANRELTNGIWNVESSINVWSLL